MDRTPEELAKQISTTLLEIGEAKFASIEEKTVNYRKKMWGID